MPFVDIKIAGGIYTEQTQRGATNHWWDGERIRFRFGLPEKLKGWVEYLDSDEAPMTVEPPVRAEHDWSSLDNQLWLALASDQKLYVINNNRLYDITPFENEGMLTDPFSTTSGSDEVIVTHTDHGVEVGQVVVFSGASAVGGLTLNGSFTVADVPDLNSYAIVASGNASSTATGGGTVAYGYEISPPVGASQTLGWGVGPYGQDDDPNYIGNGWGTAREATNLRITLPTWSLDNWGEDLMASRIGGPIYIWERSSGPDQRARIIPNAPVSNNWIIVSPEDRHLISLGSHDGTQRDQSLIRWCSAEDFNDWTPAEGNTSGDKRLDSGSRIITAVRTRGETIIWTDTAMYSMSFVGGDDIFQFQPKGESLTIVSPNAAVEAAGIVFFMAKDEFIAYDGVTTILPCTVRNYVFGRIDRDNIEKVYAAVNKENSEVWWFYPSTDGAGENDSYVVFNYRDKEWYYGTLDRTAYTDAGYDPNPIAVDAQGRLYRHESGYEYVNSQMDSYVESYGMEINNIGEQFVHIDKVIPDFLVLQDEVLMTFRTRGYPTGTLVTKGPYTVDATTRKINMRARGRQIAVRIEDNFQAPVSTLTPWDATTASGVTLSDADYVIQYAGGGGSFVSCISTVSRTASKYYFELVAEVEASGATVWGIGVDPGGGVPNFLSDVYGFADFELSYAPGQGGTSAGVSFYTPTVSGDVFGCAVDFDEGTIWFSRNGVWTNNQANSPADPALGTNPRYTGIPADDWFIYGGFSVPGSTANTMRIRTALADFAFGPPDGFSAWDVDNPSGAGSNIGWRFGTLRVNAIPDGMR